MDELTQWRESIRKRVLIAILPLALLMLLMVELQWPLAMGLPARIAYAVFLGAICLTTVLPRVTSRTRTMILIAICFAIGFGQLARAGLASDGRVTLSTLPVFALVMLGPRAGWICMAISGGIYLLAMSLQDVPWFRGLTDTTSDVHSIGGWAANGAAMAIHVFTGMLLVTLLVRKQLSLVRVAQNTASHLAQESRHRHQLQEQLLRVGAEDRQLIAAELHDGLCQQLTAARLRIAAAESIAQPAAAADFAATRQILTSCVDDAYALMDRLAPLEMSPDSLPQLLERLAAQTRQGGNTTCTCSIDGVPSELDPTAVLHLYRIAQEAVRNSLRHAQAREIGISLALKADTLVLLVSDDGVGIADSPSRPGGRGIKSMHYRSSRIGASLTLAPRERGGTLLSCEYPLNAEPPSSHSDEPGKG